MLEKVFDKKDNVSVVLFANVIFIAYVTIINRDYPKALL